MVLEVEMGEKLDNYVMQIDPMPKSEFQLAKDSGVMFGMVCKRPWFLWRWMQYLCFGFIWKDIE